MNYKKTISRENPSIQIYETFNNSTHLKRVFLKPDLNQTISDAATSSLVLFFARAVASLLSLEKNVPPNFS